MVAHTAEDIAKEVKVYVGVFVVLMVLTIATVAVSYADLTIGKAIVVAMMIASIKGLLVACYFMHLLSEKTIIYWALGITIVFFAILMLLPVMDVQFGAEQTSNIV